MRETQVERVSQNRDQTYRVNPGVTQGAVEQRLNTLSADMNRLLQDIAIRLQRVEQRLTELEKK